MRLVWPTARFPEVGVVYTIREVRTVTIGPNAGQPCLFLEGIFNPVIETLGNKEPGMPISAFRPLISKTQEQDVELFRHLLSPSPIDAGLIPAGVELDA
jgi:hypothetical protein